MRLSIEGTFTNRLGLGTRLAGIFFLLAAVTGCEEKAPPPPPAPPEVVVTELAGRDVPVHVEWVGTVDGNVNAQIRARVKGYLQSRDYTEGAFVRAGDLLFTIDARPYQAALDQARGELGRAQAALTKAQQDVARYTPLAAEGAISQQELDNAVQSERAARAVADSARAAVDKAQLDLDWTQVRSPIDGVAGIATTNVGDLVSESTVLTAVSQVDPVRVSFSISEQEYLRYADRVQLNGSANGSRAETLELILADGNVYSRRGSAVIANREVDRQTGTMKIVGSFPNPTNLLRPGQYAKVRALIETRPNAIVVPQRAVLEVQGTYQVAVVRADNTVEMRAVTPGARIGNERIIETGLQSGDRIVVDGLQKIRNGATVRVRAAAPN